ncbi:MAG TPA: hypothetical protein VF791_19675 [Pyrinomonadaceae bacterium]
MVSASRVKPLKQEDYTQARAQGKRPGPESGPMRKSVSRLPGGRGTDECRARPFRADGADPEDDETLYDIEVSLSGADAIMHQPDDVTDLIEKRRLM